MNLKKQREIENYQRRKLQRKNEIYESLRRLCNDFTDSIPGIAEFVTKQSGLNHLQVEIITCSEFCLRSVACDIHVMISQRRFLDLCNQNLYSIKHEFYGDDTFYAGQTWRCDLLIPILIFDNRCLRTWGSLLWHGSEDSLNVAHAILRCMDGKNVGNQAKVSFSHPQHFWRRLNSTIRNFYDSWLSGHNGPGNQASG